MVRWSSLCGKHLLHRIRVDNIRALHFQAVPLSRVHRRNSFSSTVMCSWQSLGEWNLCFKGWPELREEHPAMLCACTQLYKNEWRHTVLFEWQSLAIRANISSHAFHLFIFVIYTYLDTYTSSARYKANTTAAEVGKTAVAEQPRIISFGCIWYCGCFVICGCVYVWVL
jgi:hypothetical protein